MKEIRETYKCEECGREEEVIRFKNKWAVHMKTRYGEVDNIIAANCPECVEKWKIINHNKQ